MDQCREDGDQTYEKEQLIGPSPSYTEQASPQQGYNTQHSNTQQRHQQEYTQPRGYQQEHTQQGGYQQQDIQPGGYQQGYGYGYQPTNDMATHPYSGNIGITTHVRRPNLLVFSIMVCIFCCCPVGIFAVYFAAQANKAADCGDYEASQRKAKATKILIGISVVLGVLVAILIVAMSSVYRYQTHTK